jgi:integration host factor subunit beta
MPNYNNFTRANLVARIMPDVPHISGTDIKLVLDSVFNQLRQVLAEGKTMEFRGFGTFRVKHRPQRKARNPRTGETIEVPSRYIPMLHFSPVAVRYVDQTMKASNKE